MSIVHFVLIVFSVFVWFDLVCSAAVVTHINFPMHVLHELFHSYLFFKSIHFMTCFDDVKCDVCTLSSQ